MNRNYDFSALRVVIVDDNRFMQRVLSEMLIAMGINRIWTAYDGSAGFQLVHEIRPDLVITDWDMEPIDGESFVKLLRRAPQSPDPYVPVIMLSGYSEERRVHAARDFGVTEFLAKPLTAKALYARLVSAVERPRSFVKVEEYFGPDRRRRGGVNADGPDRRAAR